MCGMKVADHPKFSCAIQLTDNTTYYFCSTGCMLRTWLHPDIFLGAPRTLLRSTVVRDYFTGQQVDGRKVFWISGSDIVGPMGPALVPVAGEAALKVFIRRHGSRTVFRLDEFDASKWFEITGRKAAR